MNFLIGLLVVLLASSHENKAQSALLESVKRNPAEATAMCQRFKTLNSQGVSSGSKEVLKEISRQKNISLRDAEILSIYVIGMNCPEVR